MTSAIDEILNANESDEEVDLSTNIDIELLLDSEELDSDEIVLPNVVNLPKKDNTNQPSWNLTTATETASSFSIEKDNAAINDDDRYTASIEQDDSANNNSLINNNDFPSSLKLAEMREQRMLSMYEKTSHSILQLRKSSSNTDLSQLTMISLKEMELISTQLKRNSNFDQYGPGKAVCFCVCPKFIGIGTERGYVLLFDHKQEIKRVLSHPSISVMNSTEENKTKFNMLLVTCLDNSFDGNCLVVGYKTGDIIFWDCAKGSIMKQIFSDQGCFLCIQFVYNIDSMNNFENFNWTVVGLTSNHVVNRYKVGKSVLSMWHVEVDCLMDDTAGKISTFSSLQPFGNHIKNFNNIVENFDIRKSSSPCQFIALSFPHQTNIVQLTPELKIVYRWKNANDRNISESIAWHWLNYDSTVNVDIETSNSTVSSSSQIIPTITRAKGNKVEILLLQPFAPIIQSRATITGADKNIVVSSSSNRNNSLLRLATSFTNNVLVGGGTTNNSSDEVAFSFLALHSVILDGISEILSIQWIENSSSNLGIPLNEYGSTTTNLIVISESEILLLDHSLHVLEKISFTSLNCFGSTLIDSSASVRKSPYLCVSQDGGMLLRYDSAWLLTIKSPFLQANELISGGKWLEALSTIVQYVQKLTDTSINSGRNGDLSVKIFLNSERNILRRYILNYALLALKRHDYVHMSTVPSLNNVVNFNVNNEAKFNPATSLMLLNRHHHIQLVANVCIEYCIAIQQSVLLYEEIYPFFISEYAQSIFLEALEPFMLNEHAEAIPSTIITDFISYAISKCKYSMIEKTIIYLPPTSLDLPSILKILYNHQMFSSLMYLISIGYDSDFVGAIQAIMCYIKSLKFSSKKLPANHQQQQDDDDDDEVEGISGNESIADTVFQADLGYKMLLFLYYTFELRYFPRGDYILLSEQSKKAANSRYEFSSLKQKLLELLQFLVSKSYLEIPSHVAQFCHDQLQSVNISANELFNQQYPYLAYFGAIDISALFVCLRRGIEQVLSNDQSIISNQNNFSESTADGEENKKTEVSKVVRIIHNIFLFSKTYNTGGQTSTNLPSNFSIDVGSNKGNAMMVRMFFDHFTTHLLALSLGIFPKDMLECFTDYFQNQICAYPNQMFGIEKKLQSLSESQSKLSVISAKDWFGVLIKARYYIAALGVTKAMFSRLKTNNSRGNEDSFASKILSCTNEEYTERLRFYLQKSQSFGSSEEFINIEKFLPQEASDGFRPLICFEYINEQYTILSEYCIDNEVGSFTERDRFEEVIIEHSIDLLHLSILSTVEIILSSQLVHKLSDILQILQSDHTLQYQFLTQLIHTYQRKHLQNKISDGSQQHDFNAEDSSGHYQSMEHEINFLMGEYLSTSNIVTYIRLLAIFNKNKVFAFLVEFPEFCPIDESLVIAKEFDILDAMSFLLQRSGDRLKAIELICQDITNKLKDARKDVDNFLKQEKISNSFAVGTNEHGFSNASLHFISFLLSRSHFSSTNLSSESAASRNAQISACMEELRDRILACKYLERSIIYLSDLCEQHSREDDFAIVENEVVENDGGDKAQVDSVDFVDPNHSDNECYGKAFDHLLQLRHELKSGTVSSSSEILSQFLSFQIQQFIVKMKEFLKPSDILTRVVQHASATNIKLGEFKDIILALLQLNHRELFINSVVKNILKGDLQLLQTTKLKKHKLFVQRSEGYPSLEVAEIQKISQQSVVRGNNRSSFTKPRDIKSMTSKAQERSLKSLPLIGVPTNITDMVIMEMHARIPGRLPIKAFKYGELNTGWGT